MVRGDDQLIRISGQLHSSGRGHRPGRAQRTARDPASRRRRGDLVSQPLRRPDLDGPQQGERWRDHDLPDPLAPAQVRPALQHVGAVVGAANSQNKEISRWPGHCLGGAVASILLNEPIPAPGSGLTRDELKALWAELGENHLNHRIGDYANEIPPGPPRPGPDETDWKVPRVHAMFETHIRGEKKPLLGNMRAFPPRGTDQRGLEPGHLQVHRRVQGDPQPRPARREDQDRGPHQLRLDAQRPG